jgi:hypothetical protein
MMSALEDMEGKTRGYNRAFADDRPLTVSVAYDGLVIDL